MSNEAGVEATTGPLKGARVGILEGRVPDQLADLVRRRGGVPRVAPALREVTIEAPDEVGALVDGLVRGEIQVVVFLTGVGAATLFEQAGRLGRLDELVRHLQGTTNLCRGQKPWRPLKEHGVPISETVPSPYTTPEVLEALRRMDLEGRGVALLHYGERNEELASAITGAGARLHELSLYGWRLPEDTGPLEDLIDEIVAGGIDAVLVTTQVQVRHLLEVAERRGRAAELVRAFRDGVLGVAVGPTAAAAMEEAGIPVHVQPENPKMGPMVVALTQYLQGTAGTGTVS